MNEDILKVEVVKGGFVGRFFRPTEVRVIVNPSMEKFIMDIEDQVAQILTTVTAIQAAVAGIAAPTVDFTPVLTAISAVGASVTTVSGQLTTVLADITPATPPPATTPAT